MKSKRKLMRCSGAAKRVLLLIFAVIVSSSFSGYAEAQTIRGRLLRGTVPVGGIGVSVVSPTEKAASGKVYSGPDGMYYFTDIPEGSYILKVWDDPKSPQEFEIMVYPQQTIDIAPIQVR